MPQREETSNSSRPVVHVLSGDLWGGSEAQMAMQLAAIRDQGFDVRAILFNEGDVSKRFSLQGIPCVFAEERLGLRKCFSILRRQIRTLRPAILLSHGYKENILSSFCSVLYGIPWIPVFHGLGEPFSGRKALKAALYYRFSEFLARVRAARIITVSEALTQALGFSGDGRVRVVRNVVTASGAAANIAPPTAGAPSGKKSVVAVGRLVRVKRIDLLIEAFSAMQIANAELVIVGDGPERETLQHQANNSSARGAIRFLGFRPDAEAIIARADVFVICSDSEGIPTVLLEAISHKRKVVSTAVGGIPEVLEVFPGYPAKLVKPASPEELACAIQNMLSTEQRVPDNVPVLLERYFSPRVAAEAHAEVYRELFRV